jgi:hypothetical protein
VTEGQFCNALPLVELPKVLRGTTVHNSADVATVEVAC